MALPDALSGDRLSHVSLGDIPLGIEHSGTRLRRLREASGWSIEAIAAEAKVAVSTYRFWETEPGRLKRSKHQGAVVSVSKVMGTNPLRVWYGDDVEAQQQGANEAEPEDVTEELVIFLARMSVKKDLPQPLRDESFALLEKLQKQQ